MQTRRARGCEVVVGGTCGGGGKGLGRSMRLGRLWTKKVAWYHSGALMWVVGLVVMSLVANLWFITRFLLSESH